ncbi:MAG: hypothetical protein MUO89_02295 [Dehalococcoidia bacterium]|nr:hypothetical protein [Dehalococcoidia bacterium]
MGRKSRRKAKLRAAARMAQGMPAQPVYRPKPLATQMAKAVAEPKAAASVKSAVTTDLANRYQYVPGEMRQIGIIAGALFLILFILAFVLH